MGLRQVLRHIGQTESGQGGIEHLEGAVENELAFDVDLQLTFALLELPGVQAIISGQAQIDAVVAYQVLRLLWRRPLHEI